jgi:hypothetical protein
LLAFAKRAAPDAHAQAPLSLPCSRAGHQSASKAASGKLAFAARAVVQLIMQAAAHSSPTILTSWCRPAVAIARGHRGGQKPPRRRFLEHRCAACGACCG